MSPHAFLAELVNDYPALYTSGPLGVFSLFSGWLMWRVDSRLGSIEHKLVGLNRTLLVDLISRESVGIQAKALARQELENLSSKPRKR